MKTRYDIAGEEMTRDPIFLYQTRPTKAMRNWDTRSVWFTREEGEAFGRRNEYNFKYWRVYCVNAEGELRNVLKMPEAERAKTLERLEQYRKDGTAAILNADPERIRREAEASVALGE